MDRHTPRAYALAQRRAGKTVLICVNFVGHSKSSGIFRHVWANTKKTSTFSVKYGETKSSVPAAAAAGQSVIACRFRVS